MRVAFVLLADGANSGPDGKLNILGAGIRVLLPPVPGAVLPMAIVAQVDAEPGEEGRYATAITITAPDGSEFVRLDFEGVVAPSQSPNLPTGFGAVISLARPFPVPGTYTLRLTVQDLAPSDYVFEVRAAPENAPG